MEVLTPLILLLAALGFFIFALLPAGMLLARDYVQRHLPEIEQKLSARRASWKKAVQDFTPYQAYIHQAPYHEIGPKIQVFLANWQQRLEDHEMETQRIEDRIPARLQVSVRSAGQILLLWPYRWLSLSIRLRRALVNLERFDDDKTWGDAMSALRGQNTALLQRIQASLSIIYRGREALAYLKKTHVQGESLSTIDSEAQTLAQNLEALKQQLIRTSTPDVVVAGQKTMRQDRLAERAETAQRQAQDWERSHEQAAAAIAKLTQAFQRVQAALDGVPAALDEAEWIEQTRQAGSQRDDLAARFTSPAVSALITIHDQAARLTAQLNSLASLMESSHSHFDELRSGILHLLALAGQVARDFTRATQLDPYPLWWDASQAGLDQTCQAIRDIAELYGLGADQTTRPAAQTPQQMEQHRQALPELADSLKRCGQRRAQTIASREALLEIAVRRKAILTPTWRAPIQQLARQAKGYSDVNWRESGTPKMLESETNRLYTARTNLLPEMLSNRLAESTLPGKLEQAKKLDADIDQYERLQSLALARWAEMQSQEQHARQILSEMQNAFARLDADPDFDQLPGESPRQISLALVEAARLGKALEAIGEGSVQGKADQISAWEQQLIGLAQDLLNTLETEIARRREALAGAIERITQTLVPPTLERAYQQAEALLRKPVAAASRPEKPAKAAEITRKIESSVKTYRQTQSIVDDFDRSVAAPIKTPYEQALNARKRAETARDQAQALIAPGHNWPPTSVDHNAIAAALEKAEIYWKTRLEAGASLTVKTIIANLEAAGHLYQQAQAQVAGLAEKMAQEQVQFQKLERDLAALETRWGKLRSRYALGDAPAGRQIAQWLEKSGRTRRSARSSYQSRQSDYASLYQTFSALIKEGDEMEVDINSGQRRGLLDILGFQPSQDGDEGPPAAAQGIDKLALSEQVKDILADLELHQAQDPAIATASGYLKHAQTEISRYSPNPREIKHWLDAAQGALRDLTAAPIEVGWAAERIADLSERCTLMER